MNHFDRSRRRFAVGLAALAGFVDAVGYLSADRYFVSFMSGNTTRLGTDLVTDTARAFIPALLILGFVIGVTLGALIVHRAGARRKPAVLGLVTVLLFVAAICRALGMTGAMMAGLVLAMGALNNTFHRGDGPSVGLTYMTGALVKVGQSIAARLSGESGSGALAYLSLWAGLCGGAVLGAAAFRFGDRPLWIAVLWAGLMVWVATRLPPAEKAD